MERIDGDSRRQPRPADGEAPTGQIQRALAVLESVAAHGSSTARAVSDSTGIPLPTVYRIARELIDADYLVHLRDEGRFALGYRLHQLAVDLHHDLGIPPAVRRELRALHDDLGMAAYLAVHRGTDIVIVGVADSPRAPRIEPMGFGFRENPHATAFGKLALADFDDCELRTHLEQFPLVALTEATITDAEALRTELRSVAASGVAWEHGEFIAGTACLAVPIRADDGTLLGSVAVSAPEGAYVGRVRHVEDRVRACASRAGRAYRLGSAGR